VLDAFGRHVNRETILAVLAVSPEFSRPPVICLITIV